MWPTWADIISSEVKESYNYGRCAAGNFFIYQSLIEAIIRHKIDKNDLVMIMFSNVTREDRFVKARGGWITPGNLYFQTEYDEEFLKKYLCDHGYLMRDLNLVHGCKLALDSIECDYELMSIVPFNSSRSDDQLMDNNVDYLLDFYRPVIAELHPSVLDLVFSGNWNNNKPRPTYSVTWRTEQIQDNHPIPVEHLSYLTRLFPDICYSRETLDMVSHFTELIYDSEYSGECLVNDKIRRLGEPD